MVRRAAVAKALRDQSRLEQSNADYGVRSATTATGNLANSKPTKGYRRQPRMRRVRIKL
jgi:hypothetical protein